MTTMIPMTTMNIYHFAKVEVTVTNFIFQKFARMHIFFQVGDYIK